MSELGEDPDEINVAEAADQEGDEEENQAELQSDRKKDIQLLRGEVLVTHPLTVKTWTLSSYADTVIGAVCKAVVDVSGALRSVRAIRANEGHDEDDAQVEEGEDPKEDAGSHSVYRPTLQRVLNGEGHAEVALHTDGREEEGAVVDGHIEDESRQWTEGKRHVPQHVVPRLLHLERQEEEKEEVRDGQVEEQDVDGRGFLPHFPAEGVEGKYISWEARHKGDDVDRQAQPSVALLHGGLAAGQVTR